MSDSVRKALQEPEVSIKFRPVQWGALLRQFDVEWPERPVTDAEVSEVCRSQIKALASRIPASSADEHQRWVLALFLWSQIWGYGTNGYGPHRVERILGGTTRRAPVIAAEEALAKCHEALMRSGPVEAYRVMANEHWVPGLGPAFLTKFLYFAGYHKGQSCKVPDGLAPLILDAVVSRAIRKEYQLTFGPGWGTRRYMEYLEFMCREARERYGVEPDQLERALFVVGRQPSVR
ncbi:MAG: hypothetical protein VB139_06925 [Coriobacteriia bacterium]|nr:hypothetical protein [Coriobacteriia bacterium]